MNKGNHDVASNLWNFSSSRLLFFYDARREEGKFMLIAFHHFLPSRKAHFLNFTADTHQRFILECFASLNWQKVNEASSRDDAGAADRVMSDVSAAFIKSTIEQFFSESIFSLLAELKSVTSASLNFFSFFFTRWRSRGRAKAIFLSAQCHKLNNWKIKQPLKQIDCMYTHKQRGERGGKERKEIMLSRMLAFSCLFTLLSHLPLFLQSIELKHQLLMEFRGKAFCDSKLFQQSRLAASFAHFSDWHWIATAARSTGSNGAQNKINFPTFTRAKLINLLISSPGRRARSVFWMHFSGSEVEREWSF